jgi:hypothetical protein
MTAKALLQSCLVKALLKKVVSVEMILMKSLKMVANPSCEGLGEGDVDTDAIC